MNWSWIKEFTGGNPYFWKEYVALFDFNSKETKKIVVIDLKTTEDEILSIAAIEIENNLLVVKNFIEINFQNNEIESNVIAAFLNFIKNATLVGYNMNFTVEMINSILDKSNLGSLKNQSIDIELMHQKLIDSSSDKSISLDELCSLYKIDKNDRHTTSDNVFIIALIFLKLKKKLEV
jgi:DNA polymerase-3 subunit epsilon